MKTPEEWNKVMAWSNDPNTKIIAKIQNEAWNEAIDEAAENVKMDYANNDFNPNEKVPFRVDKQSILKLKK